MRSGPPDYTDINKLNSAETSDKGEHRKITISEIAKESGLSVATVSKVLNGRPDVSAATRAKIQHLILARGYRKRSAPEPQTPFIDVVFEEFDSPWAVEIVQGAMAAAEDCGLGVALTSLSQGDERKIWFDQITSRGTKGIILLLSQLTSLQRDELYSRRLPFVVIDPRGEPDPLVNSVGATNWAGGRVATKHLLDLGHRRIAIITGPHDLLSARARLDGYRAALESADLVIDDQLCRWGNFHLEGGYDQAKLLLSLDRPPTAIFAGSDLQALGVLQAARELNLRIPDDLSLVGFDDLPISQWSSPPLTTIHQPIREMAALAVKILIDPNNDMGTSEQRIELATHLVVRESTKVFEE